MEQLDAAKISIVLPLYNASRTIESVLKSVDNQTINCPLEVIVVNDGSTDNSLNIVKNYVFARKNISLIVINQTNSGVSRARNRGIIEANGQWIALIDSDDEWLPIKIETQWKIIQQNPFIDFLGCNLVGQEVILPWRNKRQNLVRIKLWELLLKIHPQTSTVLIRRDVLLDIGLYDEGMTHGEDVNLWMRICNKKQMYFCTESLVVYDGGKIGFTGKGLAANLKKMHEGEMYNLKYAKKKKLINLCTYFLFVAYYKFKYLRRILISKVIML